MDWIERWFGVAPDNGDGSLEWAISITLFVIFVGLAVWSARRRTAKRQMKERLAKEQSAGLPRGSEQSGRS